MLDCSQKNTSPFRARLARTALIVTAMLWPYIAPEIAIADPNPGEIRQIQESLKAKGFDPGTPDGIFGERTRRSIRHFQKVEGLPVTGELTAETTSRLGAGSTTPPTPDIPPAVDTKPPPTKTPPTLTLPISDSTAAPIVPVPPTVTAAPKPPLVPDLPPQHRSALPLPTQPQPASTIPAWSIWALVGAVLGLVVWRLRRKQPHAISENTDSRSPAPITLPSPPYLADRTTVEEPSPTKEMLNHAAMQNAVVALGKANREITEKSETLVSPTNTSPLPVSRPSSQNICGKTSSCRNLGADICPLKQGQGRSDCPSYAQIGSIFEAPFPIDTIKAHSVNATPPLAVSSPPNQNICGKTSSCQNLGADICPLKHGQGRSDCPSYAQIGMGSDAPPPIVTVGLPLDTVTIAPPSVAKQEDGEMPENTAVISGETGRPSIAEYFQRHLYAFAGGTSDAAMPKSLPLDLVQSAIPTETMEEDCQVIADTRMAGEDTAEAPLSPGEINRRRVAEILKRQAPLRQNTAVVSGETGCPSIAEYFQRHLYAFAGGTSDAAMPKSLPPDLVQSAIPTETMEEDCQVIADTRMAGGDTAEVPLSPGEANRRRVAEILERKAARARIVTLLKARVAALSNTGISEPSSPDLMSPVTPNKPAEDGNQIIVDAGVVSVAAAGESFSPGEANRRRVAEILERQASLRPADSNSPPLPAGQTDAIDWNNLGLGRSAPSITSAAPFLPTAESAKVDDAWVPVGQTVTVAGMVISGGLLYVGEKLPMIGGGSGPDNCLIDPTLPVRAGYQVCRTYYFPSYAGLDPVQRHAYLHWLASGRLSPDVDMGYVFMYFYGLERRLIGEQSRDEAPQIIAEIERLRSIYGTNGSFARYSEQTLTMARLLFDGTPQNPPEQLARNWEMPLDIKIALGLQVAKGNALSGAWMLTWLHFDQEVAWRTPATRAPDIFRTLFLRRFTIEFPRDLPVKPPQRRLSASYRACSGTFTATLSAEYEGAPLPDVTALTAPLKKVRPIAEACMAALDHYSRFIGRNPDKADSLEAFALLPADLADLAPPAVIRLREWLNQALAHGAATVSWREAAEGTGLSVPVKPGKRDLQALAVALESLGVGVEPNPAFGGRVPKSDEPLVLFRLTGAEAAPGPAYLDTVLRLTLAVLVAGADGTIAGEERALVAAHIADTPGLSERERNRLAAHAHWLEVCPPDTNGLKSRVAELSTEARDEVGRLAIAMAAIDGRIDAAEIKLLQKLYKMLGLDPEALYSDLHALGASNSTTASPSELETPAAPNGGLQLDPERIRQIQADTARVSSVLGAVFAEETPPPEPLPIIVEDTEDLDDAALSLADCRFDGLDPPYATLLRELTAVETWRRGDYETLARSLDLMPDGAMETINEWAFDRFDEAVLESGDDISVAVHLLQTNVPESAAHV